jgi:hypothetical protein
MEEVALRELKEPSVHPKKQNWQHVGLELLRPKLEVK